MLFKLPDHKTINNNGDEDYQAPFRKLWIYGLSLLIFLLGITVSFNSYFEALKSDILLGILMIGTAIAFALHVLLTWVFVNLRDMQNYRRVLNWGVVKLDLVNFASISVLVLLVLALILSVPKLLTFSIFYIIYSMINIHLKNQPRYHFYNYFQYYLERVRDGQFNQQEFDAIKVLGRFYLQRPEHLRHFFSIIIAGLVIFLVTQPLEFLPVNPLHIAYGLYIINLLINELWVFSWRKERDAGLKKAGFRVEIV